MTETLSQLDFLKMFDTEQKCIAYLEKIRWYGYTSCPHCGSFNPYRTNRGFKCSNSKCHKKFTYTSSTLFDNTKIPLRTWFFLIHCQSIRLKNISSVQEAKNLGLTQNAMWKIQDKIRGLFKQDDNLKLSGICEVDEAFVSKSKNNTWTRWGGITTRKEPIIGIVQRGGKVVIKEIKDRKRETILEMIERYVQPGSTIYSDGHPSYKNLPSCYTHDFVEHSTQEYVRGEVHTNTIENIWSGLKKSIRYAHHSVSEKHLQKYCDEVAWRYNNRHLSGHEKFNKILELCLKKSYD